MMAPARIGRASLIVASALVSTVLAAPAFASEIRATLSPETVTEGESVQLRIEVVVPYSTAVFDPEFDSTDFISLGSSSRGSSLTYSSDPNASNRTFYYSYVLSPNKKGTATIRNIRVRTNKGTLEAPDQSVTVEASATGNARPRGGRGQPAPRGQGGGFGGFPGMPPGFQVPRIEDLMDDDERAFFGLPPRGQGGQAPGQRPSGRPPLPPGFGFDDEEQEDDQSNPAAPGFGLSNPSPPGAGRIGALRSDDIPKRFNSDFTVHAALSKRKAYVGEPIVVEYSLYDFGGLQEVAVNKWPTFTGFWKEDLEITNQFRFEQVYVGDQLARKSFVGRFAIYGIKPGKFNLDKLTIQARYRESGFNRGGFLTGATRQGTHSSQDETIEILPLPTEGKPAKFTGAVGRFAVGLETDKTTIPQNTPVTFTVRVTGAGNFQSIESVPVPLPPDFEIFDSNTNGRGVAPIGSRRELESSKTFTYTAIPRKAGKFTVEPIVWNYFDPELGKYVEVKTQPIELNVIENAAGAAQGTNSYLPGGGGGGAGAPTGGDGIRGLKAVGASARGWDISVWLKLVLGALGVLNIYLLYRFLEVKAGKFLGRFLDDPFEPAKNLLADAKAAKGTEWLGHLEDALLAAMAVRLGTNLRGMPRAEQEELWREKGLPGPLFGKIAGVMDRLDRERFSAGHGKDAGRVRAALQMDAAGLVGEMGRRK